MEQDDILVRFTLSDTTEITSTGEEIGRGAYGRVFKVNYYGTLCAAKEIHSILLESVGHLELERTKTTYLRECRQCCALRHPNIVQFLGLYYPSSISHSDSYKKLPIIVMELMEESLKSYVESSEQHNTTITYLLKLSILHDVAQGLRYLHHQNPPVVHRDLSPNNILLTAHKVAKISDLGVAKVVKLDSKNTMTRAPGTSDFMPPEALQGSLKYNTMLDMFSYGGITLFLISQCWPELLPVKYFDQHLNKVTVLSEVERRQPYIEKMTEATRELKPLVLSCLDENPIARPTATELLDKLKQLKSKYHDREYKQEVKSNHESFCDTTTIKSVSERESIKLVNEGISTLQLSTGGRHCKECKEFHEYAEFGCLCTECLKYKSKEESTAKPSQQQLQQNPTQEWPYQTRQQPAAHQQQPVYNQGQTNPPPHAKKCKECKEFFGYAEFGGLCAVCFRNLSEEESTYTTKPSQKELSGLRQNPIQKFPFQAQQQPPTHQQQPVYNQGQTNPLPVASFQPERTSFGFNQCMSQDCARPADEQCQGYCTQCFATIHIYNSKKLHKEHTTKQLYDLPNPTLASPYKTQQRSPKHQQKPVYSQSQTNPPPVNNNAEEAADKCKVCKDFHGYAEFGGLCSVCLKNKTREESRAKPPQQQLNDLRQNPIPPFQAQQRPPAHQQQSVYNQGQTNPPPVAGSQPQPNPFGFNQCMSHGCARPEGEQCHGYCTQCFANIYSVARFQKSQHLQRAVAQQGQQKGQQQPVYNQGQTNPPPVASSQPQPNPFGFNQCMSHFCARPADEQCQGYCTQCFANSVARYQKS